MKKPKSLTKREYWLILKLIESLRMREVRFEGWDDQYKKDFDTIRDKCLDRAYDYKP